MLWQIILIILILSLVIVRNRWKKKNFMCRHNLRESGFVSFPIVGHAYMFLGDDEAHMEAIKKLGHDAIKKGGASAIWMFHYLYIGISDPALVEQPMKFCLEKGQPATNLLRSVTGDGSMFAPVSIWQPIRRKVISPHFIPKNLTLYVEIFAKHSSILAGRLRSVTRKTPFSVLPFFASYSMHSVFETSLGYTKMDPNNPLLKMIDDGMKIMAHRLVTPWLYSDYTYMLHLSYYKFKDYLEKSFEFINSIIISHNENRGSKKDSSQMNDSFHSLPTYIERLTKVDSQRLKMSKKTMCEELLGFVIAGTDTSSAAASFTAMCLAQHQDVQNKVYQELKEVFQDSDRLVTVEDLSKLEYLECVIKETLRLYPPAPILIREVNKDIQLENGVILPKGSNICIFIYSIHRHPHYWGHDADDFRPERFLEPLKHPAQFIPFSIGPRNCAGYGYAMMSLKTVLATILRQYRFLPAVNGSKPLKDTKNSSIRMKFNVMLKEVSQFTVNIEPRL